MNSTSRQLLESGLQKVWCVDTTRHSSPDDSQVLGIERKLRKILQSTKVIKNTFPPVNRLPPEILSSILEHRASDLDLVAATHVCRHWRSTLISNPSLWTDFWCQSGHDVDRTLTYLKRSKSAPIDVEVDVIVPQDTEALEYFAPHIARTRSLIIDGIAELTPAACLLLCNPAPSLQHLDINRYGHHVHLPDDFLGRHAPSLRRILLCDIHPTFGSPFPLPNLTEFSLRLLDSAPPLRMSALSLFLSGSPRLKKVSIDTPNNEILQDVARDQVISLESLEELDCTCKPAGRVLPYIRLPRLKRLHVCFLLGPGQVQKLADLLPYDGHLLLKGVTKVEYYHSNSNTQHLAFDDGDSNVMLEAHLPHENPIPVDWFSDPKYIPLIQIRRLVIGCSLNNMNPPIAIFENLEELHTFPWGGPFTEGLLPLLYPGAETPCRSLKIIHYTNLEPLGPLVSLAKARLQAGHRLELVHLPIITESELDNVAELRELVGRVQAK